jgi:3-hydroxybutyrate dehydrogenase
MSRSLLITGASRGIGRAVAYHQAELEAAELWLIGRDGASLEETAKGVEIRGGRAVVRLANVTDRNALAGVASEIPRLDGIVAAAGMSGETPLNEPCDDLFDQVLTGNLTSAWNTARAFVPRMDMGGRIVFVASVLGRFGVPFASAYVAAKHGVIGLTRALALELLPKGIIVNAVAPGWVDTEMAAQRVREFAEKWKLGEPEARKRLERAVPVNRFFQPEEIARGVAWMLDPANTMQVGQCLNLDGGVIQE